MLKCPTYVSKPKKMNKIGNIIGRVFALNAITQNAKAFRCVGFVETIIDTRLDCRKLLNSMCLSSSAKAVTFFNILPMNFQDQRPFGWSGMLDKIFKNILDHSLLDAEGIMEKYASVFL